MLRKLNKLLKKYLKYYIGIIFVIGLSIPVNLGTDNILSYMLFSVIGGIAMCLSVKMITILFKIKHTIGVHYIGWFFLSAGLGQSLSSLILYGVFYSLGIAAFFLGLSFLICINISLKK